jgi:hypothetical protein
MMPAFEGLQPSDFMNTASRTTWHGRNQLGGAVTNQLPTDNFVFNLWALAQWPLYALTVKGNKNLWRTRESLDLFHPHIFVSSPILKSSDANLRLKSRIYNLPHYPLNS